MIYFITYESLPGYVKIGFSKDMDALEGRLSHYVTYNPTPLKILKVEEGDYWREQALHAKWNDYRAPNGEWFYFAKPIQDYLNGEITKDDVNVVPTEKHLRRRTIGSCYTFDRRIPERLRKFSQSASKICPLSKNEKSWSMRLDYDYDKSLMMLEKLVKQTTEWIRKHEILLDKIK